VCWITRFKGPRQCNAHPFFTLIIIICLWQFSSKFFSIPEYILPSPLQISAVFQKIGLNLIKHSFVTLQEILLGFVIGAGLGFILAIVISLSKFLYRNLYPLLIAVQSIPKLALAPLFIIWFGFGMLPKVAITVLVVLFPVLVNTLKGLVFIEPGLVELTKSLRASSLQVLLKVRMPSCIPYLFASLKISITLATVGAVIGEFLGADKGLGYIIMLSSVDLNTSRMFAALILLAIIGLFLFYLVSVLERIIMPWHIIEEK
jgi:NitT/TauT family transport system permease protein